MRSPFFCFSLLLNDVTQYVHSFQLVIDGGSSSIGPTQSSNSITQRRKAGDRSRGTIFTTSSSLFVEQERRPFLQNVAQTLLISSSLVSSPSGDVVNAADVDQSPKVTHKVFMDVRISRADGSFYVRDTPEDPSLSSSEPFYGTLVFGLFGDRTPIHVQRFLDYIDVPYDVDSPLPSYSRSKFNTLDASTGLLIGGTIPGLEATILAGGTVLQYSGRVLPAKLWLENNNNDDDNQQLLSPPLSHSRRGLLTHRNLDLTPSFGITTRSSSNCDSTCMSLDATHTIFGCVLEDTNGFLDKVVDVPALTDAGIVTQTTTTTAAVKNEIPPTTMTMTSPHLPTLVSKEVSQQQRDEFESLASGVFTTQRRIFRDAAKTFGDSRLDKVYEGKLLRRIEVTKVGLM
jgi:cyclophilin family peptidyl-prolyl cis-trans isomerase